MGLYTIPVSKQSRGSTGGLRLYPNASTTGQDIVTGDDFDRETLTPTGFPTIYTKAATGSDTSAMQTNGTYRLITSQAIGDDVDLRVAELNLRRNASIPFDEVGNSLEIQILFRPTVTTNTEGFVGVMADSHAALTALPTTAKHMGIYWDSSANANFILTSGNGSAQATTNTNTAIGNTIRRLRIQWTAADTATLDYIANTVGASPIATHNVTDIGTPNKLTLHFFIQTEVTAAARTLELYQWYAKWS